MIWYVVVYRMYMGSNDTYKLYDNEGRVSSPLSMYGPQRSTFQCFPVDITCNTAIARPRPKSQKLKLYTSQEFIIKRLTKSRIHVYQFKFVSRSLLHPPFLPVIDNDAE